MNNIQVPKYATVTKLQETTDGGYCYVAVHPELPNCLSQGITPEEARENLEEATIMVIEYLITNNLPIPKSQSLQNIRIDTEDVSFSVEKQIKTIRKSQKNNFQVVNIPSAYFA